MASVMNSQADPKAVAVARAVYGVARPESVILFGSRARGDYGADSDIDLMVIHSGQVSADNRRRARQAAMDATLRVYGDYLDADLVWMPRDRYAQCRNGVNHVAAQAARDGVDMNGEKERYEPDANSRFDWADVRQRVINANRELAAMDALISADAPQEAIGFHAQQALENILKGWISAFGVEYGNTHELDRLLSIVRSCQGKDSEPAGEGLAWLTEYAVAYRYEGARIAIENPRDVYFGIDRVVQAAEERIKGLTGVSELPRYEPPTRRGGVEDEVG